MSRINHCLFWFDSCQPDVAFWNRMHDERYQAAPAATMRPRRYGFLSENVEFATAIQEAGIQFLGPDPATFRMFSRKHTARAIAEAAQVHARCTGCSGHQ